VSVKAAVAEWEVRARLQVWREREQDRMLSVNRDLGETTVELLHDQAVEAVVRRVCSGSSEGVSDRKLRDWLREALRVRVKNHRLTLASQATVDRFEVASEQAAASGPDAPGRVVALEATRMTLEFEAMLTERERQVERLRRADVAVAQIGRQLGVKRADVRAVQYAIDVKRDLFDHDLATGELCAVRQRFIALAADGAAGVRMRALVGLHVAWCPSCRPLLALSMREVARRALGVLAPVPPVLERAWRRAGGLLRPSGSTRIGELVAARIPETLGSAGGVCATAGACALLAGGTVVGVRAVDLAASTPPRHREQHDARVHHQMAHASIARPAGNVSVRVKAFTTTPPSRQTTGSTPTQTTTPASAATVAARRAAARRAAARKKAVAAQIARATGQFGQPGVVEGNSPSPAPVVSADLASAQSSSSSSHSSTSASSGATSGSGSSTHSSTSSSGQPSQFFTP
jgi:hypothetical protein